MDKKYNYELIKDYLDGLLDKSASDEMKQLIETDETAQNIAKGILILKYQLENEEAVDKYLNDFLIIQTKKIRSSYQYIWWKIAASISLLTIIGIVAYNMQKESLNDFVESQLADHYEYVGVVRGEMISEKFDQALSAYSMHDYASAADILLEIDLPEAHYFRGLSLLQLDDYELAIAALEDSSIYRTRYSEQALWYLTLAYIQTYDLSKAEQKLNQLISTNENFKKSEMKRLLELLKE